VGDAVATAAWLNPVPYPPLLTQQQIRVPYFSIYSIIAVGSAPTLAYVTINTPGFNQTPGTYLLAGIGGSGQLAEIYVTVNENGTVTIPPTVVNPGFGYATGGVGNPPTFTLAAGGTPATFTAVLNAQLTIDRLWTDPPIVAGGYFIYQCYFALPPGYKRLFNARDLVNNNPLDFWSYTQIDLANIDAQRTVFDQPLYLVPLGIDTRVGSSTYGQELLEMWPGPLSQLSYTFMCQCNWRPLQNPGDILPYPISEELVKERAYEMLSLWKAMQVGDDMERGSGANWPLLAKAHHDEYKDLLRQARIMDRHLMELYFQKAQQTPPPGYQDGYATVTGQINLGVF
jgi:hypothetical protein